MPLLPADFTQPSLQIILRINLDGTKMSAFVPEVQPQLRMLCRSLARIVQEYYKDPLHRAEFEKWHLEKYGEPYVWIPVNDASEVGK